MDRIDYSNDTATASAKGPLENSRSTMAASGTSDFGYWSGGYPYYTKASRIDYSNDTATAVAKAPYPSTVTPYGFSNSAGTGNSTHGYAAGGNGYNSYVWRIDYSNDTANGVEKGSLSQGRLRLSAVSAIENGLPSSPTGDRIRGTFVTSPSSTTAYGYIAGGDPTTTYVDRIDFGNDTAQASPKGNLTQQRYNYNQSIGNRTYGYVMGGYTPSVPEPNGNLSSIDRINYSNDTATAPSVANLNASPGIYAGATTGNTDYGYLAGGAQHPGPTFSTIRRFDYSSDTSNTVDKSTLSGSKNFITGTGNLSFGYFGGSYNNTTIERLDYASDTTQASPKGTLSLGLRLRASVGDSNFGYFSGGQNPSPAIPDGYNDSTIERINYSSDTATASPKGPMSSARYLHAATGSATGGYHVGGRIGSSPGSTSDRLDYSNDTSTTSPKGNMTRAARSWSGVSPQEDGLASQSLPTRRRFSGGGAEAPATASAGPAYGYISGGPGETPHYSTIQRIDYSNDNTSPAPKGNLTAVGHKQGGISSLTYGYVCGGLAPGNSSIIARIDYANDDTTAALKGNLTSARRSPTGVGNKDYGYVGGGMPRVSTVDRVDYSNDTATAVTKGPLSSARYEAAGAGNLSYGYLAGGSADPGYVSTVDRIDYSSDTGTTPTKGPLNTPTGYTRGTGNLSYGYVGGGYAPTISTVQRIDYSNDTATAATKGPLSIPTWGMGSVSSASGYGYYAGGGSGGSGSIVNRIEFANDTATGLARANMSTQTGKVNGVSAQNYGMSAPTPVIAAPDQPPFSSPEQLYNPAISKQHGYWACGVNRDPAPSTICFSSVDRLDFSNDTTAASPKGNASFATSALQSVANASYGYITGGYTDHPTSGRQSSINRLDYANDTASLTVTGSTPSDVNPEGIYLGWGVGNASYGYWGGNYPGSSRIFRLDYSNDTSAPIITGKYFNGSYADAAGNQSYGWIAGKSPSGSRVERLDYSNDSNNTVTKGPLTSNRYDGGAASNSSYGWFGGGKNGSPGFSTVDRIDFSNDTPTASPKGNLANAVALIAATGDPNYGYFGGAGPAFSAKSYIQRIEYANDTATASPKGPLSVPRSASTAFSAAANAMP